jgi:lysophospholipid acyltransferase (LPLAT)-like uncharacterized protein
VKIRVPRRLVRVAAGPLVSMLAGSWRRVVRDADRYTPLRGRGEPIIFLLWHEVLLPLLWHHRGEQIAIVVSQGREGQYLADYAEGLGYRICPGSSSRGGARALLGAVRALEGGGVAAFTPDGPRGPRREVKPGVAAAAQRAGAWIVPLHATVDRAWRLRSWDRMVVPKPLARVTIGYGQPFRVEAGDEGLVRGIAACGEALATLERELEAT